MTEFITLPTGARIHVSDFGKGDTIVFVHADFLDSGMWRETMAALSPHYRVVSFDKQGYGSSKPATGPICRRRELSSVIRGMGLGPVHLVGCSNGGLASLDLALDEPGLVRSLTLVNSTPSGFQMEGAPPAELLEMFEANQARDIDRASELQLRIWFDGPARSKERLDSGRLEARDRAGKMNRIFVERGTFMIADAFPLEPLDPPALARLGEIKSPTLVISSKLDYSETQRAARIMAEGIPKARFVEIPDCAHVPSLEAPEEFTKILAAFLVELR